MTTWQPGDRIAGVTQGSNKCNPSEGVFGDYALVREGVQIRIPDNVSDVDAATIGVAFATTGLVLYQQLSLPWPGSWVSAECFVLVYGGSTSTGSIAVQFAKLSGTRVVTTCSPRNFDFCKRLGAEEVFDYNDPDCASQIREYTQDKLHFVMDCFAGEPGTAICANAISSRGGQISSIIPGAEYPRKEDVRSSLMLAYKALGEPWFFTEQMPATHEDYEFSKMFCRLEEIVLREGKVKTHPTNVREGLENVEGGLDEMRRGVVSAKKLVYKIAD